MRGRSVGAEHAETASNLTSISGFLPSSFLPHNGPETPLTKALRGHSHTKPGRSAVPTSSLPEADLDSPTNLVFSTLGSVREDLRPR